MLSYNASAYALLGGAPCSDASACQQQCGIRRPENSTPSQAGTEASKLIRAAVMKATENMSMHLLLSPIGDAVDQAFVQTPVNLIIYNQRLQVLKACARLLQAYMDTPIR